MSLVLRHQPARAGLTLDPAGWTPIADLLRGLHANGLPVDRETLARVVAGNDKQRFAISEDGLRIRAHQGHSVPVDLALAPALPPAQLFHGTATRNVDSIFRTGLHAGKRHHVHLSVDVATATKVGARHGRPVVFTVHAERMHAAGHEFFLSANGVWLTGNVPPEYLELRAPLPTP